MERKYTWVKILLRALSYVLVAAIASAVTLVLWGSRVSKLTELEAIIDWKFIGEADSKTMQDAAAAAMVESLGDRWSYYIPAEQLADYQENKDNAYVGIGITIREREDGAGLDVLEVTPGGSAQEAGLLPGDILVEVEGQSVAQLGVDGAKNLIRGTVGTEVSLAVLRNGEEKSFTMERRQIKVQVATAELLADKIGLIRIANFNTNCAAETIAAIEQLQKQGAEKFIFDVRNNPGGYVNEMLEVLDYLLPKGVLYRDLDYTGKQGERRSDADCLEAPMAVLMNGNSYSAAEFFAATLQEFEWATLVGEPTTGKGHYQNTFVLSDGSAVNLSTGKYFTGKGVNLTEAGGLIPDAAVEVDEQTAAMIYAQAIPAEEDPQIQAAVQALTEKDG